MPAMSWPTKWSAHLKAGVFSAVFEHGLTVTRAHELAQRGELPQLKPGEPRPAAAPDLPRGTVADWCRHERARRTHEAASREAPAVVLKGAVGRLAAVLEREVTRIENRARNGKVDVDRVRSVARAAGELQRLAKAVGEGAGASVQTSETDSSSATPAGTDDWLSGLESDATG